MARSLVEINRALGGGWQIRLNGAPPVELPPVEEIQPVPADGEAGTDAALDDEMAADVEESDPAFQPTPEITLPEKFDGQQDLPEVD